MLSQEIANYIIQCVKVAYDKKANESRPNAVKFAGTVAYAASMQKTQNSMLSNQIKEMVLTTGTILAFQLASAPSDIYQGKFDAQFDTEITQKLNAMTVNQEVSDTAASRASLASANNQSEDGARARQWGNSKNAHSGDTAGWFADGQSLFHSNDTDGDHAPKSAYSITPKSP